MECPSYIRVLKRSKPNYSVSTSHMDVMTTVDMELVQWFFPESTAKGVRCQSIPPSTKATRGYDFGGGVLVIGYRCPECRKVFICADISGYRHECTESDA